MFTIVDAAIYLQKNEIGRVVATQVLLVAFVIHKKRGSRPTFVIITVEKLDGF